MTPKNRKCNPQFTFRTRSLVEIRTSNGYNRQERKRLCRRRAERARRDRDRNFSVGALSVGKYFACGDHAQAMIALADSEASETVFQKIGELSAQDITAVKQSLDTVVPSYLSWAKEMIKLFWTFRIPWGWTYSGSLFPDWVAQFSFGSYSLLLTSLLIGLIVMSFFKPRTWFAF